MTGWGKHMRVLMKFAAALCTAVIVFGSPQTADAQNAVVFAAASLTNALDEAARLFEQQGGAQPKISYAASSALAKQIESGAPAEMQSRRRGNSGLFCMSPKF